MSIENLYRRCEETRKIAISNFDKTHHDYLETIRKRIIDLISKYFYKGFPSNPK